MTIEILPAGVACQLHCGYCYQNPLREAGNINTDVDVDKILEAADRAGNDFALFGGEPLLASKPVLEKLFAHGFEKWGKNSIQTNGALIDADHIEMFKKFNVAVGISVDGPGELNDFRFAGRVLGETRQATQKTLDAIAAVRRAGLSTSVIVTLHKLNGTHEKLPRLKDFIVWLSRLGVIYGNIHTLEIESAYDREAYALTESQNAAAFLDLAAWFELHPELIWSPFRDMKSKLAAEDWQTSCVWNLCDPLTTEAVHGIEPDGTLSNCGRTAKEGVKWRKGDAAGYERYISLYQSPQDKGGCQGCRFFMLCGGQCPGESLDRDWRNKTEHCQTITVLYQFYEQRMLAAGTMPVSLAPNREQMERRLLHVLHSGKRVTVAALEASAHLKPNPPEHGDSPHGDTPHGDNHGDSWG